MRRLCGNKKAIQVAPLDAPVSQAAVGGGVVVMPTSHTTRRISVAKEDLVLSPEAVLACRELTRILSMRRYVANRLFPYTYGQHIKLATNRDKMSLRITGAALEKYEPMFMAAIQYLVKAHPGKKLIIRAFQSASCLMPGTKLGDNVSLSYYIEAVVPMKSLDLIVLNRSGKVEVLSTDAYMELFEKAEEELGSPLALADSSQIATDSANLTPPASALELTAATAGAGLWLERRADLPPEVTGVKAAAYACKG